MPTRQIVYLSDGQNVKKIVPTFEELRGKKFPALGAVSNEEDEAYNRIYELLDGASLLCKSAVIQQYNEYIISQQQRGYNILAPLQFISTDERNIPILGYPRFDPLVSNETFYRYSDEECLVELGMAAAKYNVDFNDVRAFIRQVKDLCIEFGLREDDILCNLSNIGYNPLYGFRVIDFGLAESNNNRFELVY